MKSFGVLGLLLISGTTAFSPAGKQTPFHDVQKTIGEGIEVPGVGFDLNKGYATVAAKYQNGTVVDVYRKSLSKEWKEMMERLSSPRVTYSNDLDNKIKQTWSKTQRRLRRLSGLPSTKDVSLISSVVLDLRQTSSSILNVPVQRFLISMPNLPNLEVEDFEEAVILAGSVLPKTAEKSLHFRSMNQSSAAWAGMGQGLCEHWRDPRDARCVDERQGFGLHETLLVSWTDEELLLEHLSIWHAANISSRRSERYPDLGFAAWAADVANGTFWDLVEEKIVGVAHVENRLVSDLMLIGGRGEEKIFLDVLWKALGSVNPDMDGNGVGVQEMWRPLQTPGFSAEFVAARGVAEFARRWYTVCSDLGWCGNEDGGVETELRRG